MSDSRNQRSGDRTAERGHFSCRRSRLDGAVLVAVRGELDIASVPELDAALRLAWASADEIVLDLRQLESMDLSGARLILDAYRRIRRAGGQLTVVRGSVVLEWPLALFGMNGLLDRVDAPSPAAPAVPAVHGEREVFAKGALCRHF